MPFPKRSLTRLQPALAEFVRKFRPREEECVLLLRATACSRFVQVGRNSCFGSTGKRTESLGPLNKSTGALRLVDTQLNSQPPGGPAVESSVLQGQTFACCLSGKNGVIGCDS
jgi:hypothetical protein